MENEVVRDFSAHFELKVEYIIGHEAKYKRAIRINDKMRAEDKDKKKSSCRVKGERRRRRKGGGGGGEDGTGVHTPVLRDRKMTEKRGKRGGKRRKMVRR